MATGRPFAPSDADLSRCVHCGLCLQHCPTYVETGLETESPRGRLYLMRALTEGRVEPTPNAIGHLDLCLQCRNCEAVCPSGVPYGRIMEGARATVLAGSSAPLSWRLRALFLRQIVARPARLRLFAELLRLYRVSGLRRLAEAAPWLRDRAILAPAISGRPFTQRGELAPGDEPGVGRAALLIGCIMPLAYGRVHEATVRVLAHNGYAVDAPPGQGCCGALHAHNGDIETARALARHNIDAFGDGPEPIAVNSAGCGAAMKEYGELLAGDAEYAAAAQRFSARVKDISELLVSLPLKPGQRPPVWAPGDLPATCVTYQDSCHLTHAQRISSAPRDLLKAIPGLQFTEIEHADRCCGAAGVYSLTQPRMSLRLLEEKMESVGRSGATVVATANPGCMAQLEAGARRFKTPVRVVHIVELLDEAYRPESAP